MRLRSEQCAVDGLTLWFDMSSANAVFIQAIHLHIVVKYGFQFSVSHI